MSLGAALAIARKELLLFFGDRRAVIVTLVTPIAIAAFFGFIFSPHGSSDQARVVVRAADEDASPLSKEVLRTLGSDTSLDVQPADAASARETVRTGKAAVGLILPKGFGEAATRALFGGGDKPEIQFLYDPSHSAELAMVRGILTEHVMEAVTGEAFTGKGGRDAVKDSLARLDGETHLSPADRDSLKNLLRGVEQWQGRQEAAQSEGKSLPAGGFTMPYQVKEEAVTGRKGETYNSYAHSFAGMGIQFILFAAIELGVGILTERQMGIWRRMRSTPVSKGTVVLGKAMSGAVITAMSLGVTLGAGMAIFGVRVNGSWPGLLLLFLLCACMASSFGLMIAAFGKTPNAARGIAIFAVLLLTMLGGGWVPAFIFPQWMQTLTLAVPTRWAVDGLDAVIWRGGNLESALLPAAVLLGFTAIFGLLATLRFPWDEER